MNSVMLISPLPSRSMALKRLRSASSVWMAISRSRTILENSRKSRLRLRSLSWASMSIATLRPSLAKSAALCKSASVALRRSSSLDPADGTRSGGIVLPCLLDDFSQQSAWLSSGT